MRNQFGKIAIGCVLALAGVSPAAYAQRFFYDALVFSPPAVRFIADTFGVSQIMIGSDYPFVLGDPDPVGTAEKAGFDPVEAEAVARGNALRFLGL